MEAVAALAVETLASSGIACGSSDAASDATSFARNDRQSPVNSGGAASSSSPWRGAPSSSEAWQRKTRLRLRLRPPRQHTGVGALGAASIITRCAEARW